MNLSASTGNVSADLNIAIAKKALDVSKQQGNAAVNLIKDATGIAKSPRGSVSAVPGPLESGRTLNRLG